jgi:flagellar basal-body rod modification protein FlgD
MTQTTAATGATSTPPPTTGVVNDSPGAQLGKDAFLGLLVAQLQHQDPSSPMDSSAMMGQLAQFSSVEQMTNVASSITQLTQANAVSQSVSLIGHQLIYVRADGTPATGIADGVSIKNGVATIDVNGVSVALADVTAVGPIASTTTPPTTNPTA